MNGYYLARHRTYLDSDSVQELFAGVVSLADLKTEVDRTYSPAKDCTGYTSLDPKSADDLDGTEILESEVLSETDDDRSTYYFRDYVTIRDGEGQPLCPREMFALLVMSEVVLL